MFKSQTQTELNHSFSLLNGWWNLPKPKMTYGDDTSNVLYGDANTMEYIFGLGGGDIIYAGLNDMLYGGSGNDILIGAAGSNIFRPEAGYDTIVLDDWSVLSRDAIFDFNAAQDKIHLNSSQFTGLAKGTLSKELFYIGEKGKGIWNPGAEDRFLYDKTNHTLEYRTEDGTLVNIVHLTQAVGTSNLSHLNFFIV